MEDERFKVGECPPFFSQSSGSEEPNEEYDNRTVLVLISFLGARYTTAISHRKSEVPRFGGIQSQRTSAIIQKLLLEFLKRGEGGTLANLESRVVSALVLNGLNFHNPFNVHLSQRMPETCIPNSKLELTKPWSLTLSLDFRLSVYRVPSECW